MSNRVKGTTTVEIAGGTYEIGPTVGAIARLGTLFNVDTFADLQPHMAALRPADMVPIMTAILAGNGHDVPAKALEGVLFEDFMAVMAAMSPKRPDGDRPPATASAA